MTTSQKPTETTSESTSETTTQTHIRVESRPSRLIAGHYTALPFPNVGPVQEVAFDIGITAINAAVDIQGMVIKGYNDHQLLVEQRWPARIIKARTGEADLRVEPGIGLAIRAIHLLMHGYETFTRIEVTIVGRTVIDGDSVQAIVNMPVEVYTSKTRLHFPLQGAWWVIQGNDWSDHHKVEVFSQPFALDFVKLGPDNSFFANSGLQLEDHYSWDQPVFATAGGKVAYVCADMPDMQPGQRPDPRMFRDDLRRTLGNAVAISHANGEFSYFAHLKQASIAVGEGDMIKRGTEIGRVGSSGQSPGPHLHFHLMEGPNIFIDQGLPVRFCHFSAGGQSFEEPTIVPTRMIVMGAEAA